MFIGTIAAALQGAMQPMLVILFGKVSCHVVICDSFVLNRCSSSSMHSAARGALYRRSYFWTRFSLRLDAARS